MVVWNAYAITAVVQTVPYVALLVLHFIQLFYWYAHLPSVWTFIPVQYRINFIRFTRGAFCTDASMPYLSDSDANSFAPAATHTTPIAPAAAAAGDVIPIRAAQQLLTLQPTPPPAPPARPRVAFGPPATDSNGKRIPLIPNVKTYFLWVGALINALSVMWGLDSQTGNGIWNFQDLRLIAGISLGAFAILFGVWLQHSIEAHFRRLNRRGTGSRNGTTAHNSGSGSRLNSTERALSVFASQQSVLISMPALGVLCLVWNVSGALISRYADRWIVFYTTFTVTALSFMFQWALAMYFFRPLYNTTHALLVAEQRRLAAASTAAGMDSSTGGGGGAGSGGPNGRTSRTVPTPPLVSGSGDPQHRRVPTKPFSLNGQPPGAASPPAPGGVLSIAGQAQPLPPALTQGGSDGVFAIPVQPALGSTGGFDLMTIVRTVRRWGFYLITAIIAILIISSLWAVLLFDKFASLRAECDAGLPCYTIWTAPSVATLLPGFGPNMIIIGIPTLALSIFICAESWTPLRPDALSVPITGLKRAAANAAAAAQAAAVVAQNAAAVAAAYSPDAARNATGDHKSTPLVPPPPAPSQHTNRTHEPVPVVSVLSSGTYPHAAPPPPPQRIAFGAAAARYGWPLPPPLPPFRPPEAVRAQPAAVQRNRPRRHPM